MASRKPKPKAKAKLTPEKWAEARLRRETGSGIREVAAWLGVDPAHVSRRAKAENWSDGKDLEDVIRRRVNEKVNGVVNTVDPKKRAEAVDQIADKRAAVQLRHQTEWDGVDVIRRAAIAEVDFDKAKLAKITSETLLIKQTGERKAWGLDAKEPQGGGGGKVVIIPDNGRG